MPRRAIQHPARLAGQFHPDPESRRPRGQEFHHFVGAVQVEAVRDGGAGRIVGALERLADGLGGRVPPGKRLAGRLCGLGLGLLEGRLDDVPDLLALVGGALPLLVLPPRALGQVAGELAAGHHLGQPLQGVLHDRLGDAVKEHEHGATPAGCRSSVLREKSFPREADSDSIYFVRRGSTFGPNRATT